MDESTREYRASQVFYVSNPEADNQYKIQLRSCSEVSSAATKYINISAEEFAAIAKILAGGSVKLLRRKF